MNQTIFQSEADLRTYLGSIYFRVSKTSELVDAFPSDDVEIRQFLVWQKPGGSDTSKKVQFTKNLNNNECFLTVREQPLAWEQAVYAYLKTLSGYLPCFVITGTETNEVGTFSGVTAATEPRGQQASKKEYFLVYWDDVAEEVAHEVIAEPFFS